MAQKPHAPLSVPAYNAAMMDAAVHADFVLAAICAQTASAPLRHAFPTVPANNAAWTDAAAHAAPVHPARSAVIWTASAPQNSAYLTAPANSADRTDAAVHVEFAVQKPHASTAYAQP
jgi:hypothetical protein